MQWPEPGCGAKWSEDERHAEGRVDDNNVDQPCFRRSPFAVFGMWAEGIPALRIRDAVVGGGSTRLRPDVDGPIVVPRLEDETSGGDGDGTPLQPTLGLCATAAGYSTSSIDGPALLDDFEDGDGSFAANGRAGTWYTYGDDYGTLFPGGGSSLVTGPGRAGSAYALHAGGLDFTEWGSGMGTALAEASGGQCLHDLSVYSGITFWARGEVRTDHPENVVERDVAAVKLLLTEADVTPAEDGGGCDGNSGGCWDSHKIRFQPGQCWERFSFDFSEFEQDGWGMDGGELDVDQVYNLGFEVSAYNDWELWVDDIGFYSGDKPQIEEDCDVGDGYGGSSGFL